MAQSMEGSLLENLMKSRYPLTNYLYRQQHFIKYQPTTQCNNTTVSAPLNSTTELVIYKRKTPKPPPSCFNVPDTLDFNASGYEMDQGSGMEDNGIQELDETLLKSIDNRLNDSTSDKTNASMIQRSSTIQLEFSPYEHNSPLEKAIQNGLNMINN